MSMSPAGSESVPKLGSAEEEVSFGQEAEAEAAGGDGAFKPKEEAAGGDGTAKRPKSEEEAAGNGAAKRPKPEEEEAAIGAAKPEAAAVVEGLKPEKAAVGDGPKPEEEQPPKVPRSVSDEGFWVEFDEEMEVALLLEKVLSGKKKKKKKGGRIKKVRLEGEAIERLLKVRPRNMPKPKFQPLPEGFHLLPQDMRIDCLRKRQKIREAFQYQQYIIDQYDKKGYADVHSYVYDDDK